MEYGSECSYPNGGQGGRLGTLYPVNESLEAKQQEVVLRSTVQIVNWSGKSYIPFSGTTHYGNKLWLLIGKFESLIILESMLISYSIGLSCS